MGKLLIGLPLVLAIGSVLLNIIFIFIFAWSYNALTHETILAKINFSKQNTSDETFTAHIVDEDGTVIGDFKIYGEQWRIDTKFMKMKYWANILGLDSRYALERFEGRYKSIQDQNSKQVLAYNLGEATVLEGFSIFGWNPFIDTEYGSSTYQEINHNYMYTVYKTQTGVIVRSVPIAKDTPTKGLLGYINLF